MKIVLVTDAWQPQVSGVANLLMELVRHLQAGGHEVVVIQPGQFRPRPCPGYPDINLALLPGRRLGQMIEAANPDAIHIATEGPLGWAARRHCLRRQRPFTTAFHTRFPEMLRAAFGLPPGWVYALLRHFHRPSNGVLVQGAGVLDMLHQRGFKHLRAWSTGVDTRLFAFAKEASVYPPLGLLARPVSLYVGRVSIEKNLEAFLALDVPGSKLVCGTGPMRQALRERYPNVHWVDVLPRHELPRVYAAADVFVCPSRTETSGMAMLEALACGVPVAAYPVDGPLQLVGDSGGALRTDLRDAWTEALKVRRHEARDRALCFEWVSAAERFVSSLAVMPPRETAGRRLHRQAGRHREPGYTGLPQLNLSHKRHRAVE